MADMNDRYLGNTQSFTFTIQQADGTPEVNISSVEFTYFKDESNREQIVGSLIDAPTGKYEFIPTATSFDKLGNFKFDILVFYTDGRKTTFDVGTIEILDIVNTD
jgi:hypothetical protein